MKKTNIKQGAVALLAFALLAGGAAAIPQIQTADAASQTLTALNDDFNALGENTNWSTNSYKVVRENYSMVYDNNAYRSWVGLNKYKVEGDCSISYKVSSHGAGGDWFGFQLGHQSFNEETGLAGAMIVSFAGGHTRLMDHEDGDRSVLTNESLEINPCLENKNVLSMGKDGFACVQIDLTRRDPSAANGTDAGGRVLYDIDYYLWREGEVKPSVPSISWEKGVGADGYIGFGGILNSVYARIYDFKISENNTVVFDAQFDKNYEVGDASCNWQFYENDKSHVYIAADSYIDTEEVKSGLLLSSSTIAVDKFCNKQFDLSFDVDCENVPEQNAAFGVGFGLSASSVRADERNFVGVQGEADGKWKFVMAYGGKVRKSSSVYDNFPVGATRFTVEGFFDGSVKLTFAGKSETFKDLDLEGNFALGTIGSVASGAKFDNVFMNVTKRVEPKAQAEDRLIDFTGTKAFEEAGETYYSKYIDNSKWYQGVGVRPPRDMGDYIQFANAGGASVFGPRTRFEEFVCRFSVTVSQDRADAQNGTAIGLSFARKAFHTDSASNPAIFFEKTANGMQMRIYNASCEQANGGIVPLNGMDFWSSEDVSKEMVTYNIMVVVRGGAANVYCAEATAPASEMAILRARLTGFDSYGFVAAAGRNGATFRLNDFSVVNTAVRR